MGSLHRELADMTAGRVDAVIAAVGRHDAELASLMRVAADGLTAGEGEERISQLRGVYASAGLLSSEARRFSPGPGTPR